MYGYESLPSVIFRYGAKEPTVNLDVVKEQLRSAHRYRNNLVEIERRRREKAAEAVRKLSPKLDKLEEEVTDLETRVEEKRDVIKKANQRARRKTTTPEQRKEIRELRELLKDARARRKEARQKAYGTQRAKKKLAVIDKKANEEQKTIRKASGLYWGTYLGVDQAHKQVRKTKAPPRFQRWTGNGRLVVEIQHGMPAAKALECTDRRFQIHTDGDSKHAVAWVRVASAGKRREPVWAVIPFVLHRKLPANAMIKWIYLTVRRIACHSRWSLCIVLSRESGWAKDDLAKDGKVGIDVGWRLREEGLRVACYAGSDGKEQELLLPVEELGRWKRAEELQSTRDKAFDGVRDTLAAWLESHDAPDWLVERTRFLRRWRSQAKLASVVLRWRQERFSGDSHIYPLVERWRVRDKHLYEWQANQRRKAVAWRDDKFRNWVAELSREYKEARIEDTNWAKMAKLPEVEEEADTQSRHYRRIGSPGRLLQLVKERFAKTTPVPAQYSTRKCHDCGKLADFDARTQVMVTCQHCHKRWDQDFNAARNLRDAPEPPKKTKGKKGAKKKPPRKKK